MQSASTEHAARFIINDTFRSDLCLLHPPHLIAIAAIYLTLVFHTGTRDQINLHPHQHDGSTSSSAPTPAPANPRRSSRSTYSTYHKKPAQDIVGFMAGLNVNWEVVAGIAQEIISLYTLWERYKEDGSEAGNGNNTARGSFGDHGYMGASGLKRTASGAMRGSSVLSGGTASSRGGTPAEERGALRPGHRPPQERPAVVTPSFLTQLLLRMRENRMYDIAHPPTGRPMAHDKRLDRAQAAG